MIADNKIKGSSGLVMCGGNSRRMGTDKCMLAYQGKPQCYHIYEMLQPFCEKVFISCNENQAVAMETGYNILVDHSSYNDIGPVAGLLTAFTYYPKNDFLIVGCDYPFLDANDLANFISTCKEQKNTAFYNQKEDLYEPLLAHYPSSAFIKLKEMCSEQQYSLQYFLKMNNAEKYHPASERSITSIDTYEDHLKTLSMITKTAVEI